RARGPGELAEAAVDHLADRGGLVLVRDNAAGMMDGYDLAGVRSGKAEAGGRRGGGLSRLEGFGKCGRHRCCSRQEFSPIKTHSVSWVVFCLVGRPPWAGLFPALSESLKPARGPAAAQGGRPTKTKQNYHQHGVNAGPPPPTAQDPSTQAVGGPWHGSLLQDTTRATSRFVRPGLSLCPGAGRRRRCVRPGPRRFEP